MTVKTNHNFILNYMAMAPFALAFERILECKIYSRLEFARPILDIGCGDGLFSKIIFADKIDTGIDPDPKEIEAARKRNIYEELITSGAGEIPKPNDFYNTIFSNSVLEHIPDLEEVFKEAHRVLSPQGRFYITVPSNCFDQFTIINQILVSAGAVKWAEKYKVFFNSFWKHYHAYSLEKWKNIAEGAGFKIIDAFMYNPKSLCLTNDLLMPLSLFGLLLKKLTHRWTLCPSIRRLLVYPFYKIAEFYLRDCDKAEKGGLVFLSLSKY